MNPTRAVREATAETLELIKNAPRLPDELAKNYTQGSSPISGLVSYTLEPGAKQLYPVLTPLRNLIARVSGKGGIQANWRAITGINTANAGLAISQGNRGVVTSTRPRTTSPPTRASAWTTT